MNGDDGNYPTVEYYWRTVYVGEYVLRTGAWGPPYPEPEKIFKILPKSSAEMLITNSKD